MTQTPQPASLAGRDCLALSEWNPADCARIVALAHQIKANPTSFANTLAGKSAVLVFEKPSLRTRVSFEVGLAKLGAHTLFYDTRAERMGERESVHDYAKNLERYADILIARVFAHDTIEQLAEHASVPVINALSDLHHPCQALADILTLEEAARARTWQHPLTIAFVGDGNNVCHSLMIACAMTGHHFRWVGPEGYQPHPSPTADAKRFASQTGATHTHSNNLNDLKDVHAIYADTWVSMGDEAQTQQRIAAFTPYRITPTLFEHTHNNAVFMHCLPAHRGEEVEASVIDDPNRSIVFDQAENRMWAQMALTLELLAAAPKDNNP